MTSVAPHGAAFCRDVASTRVVWTIRDDKGFPAPIGDGGRRAMPFWSSKSRAMRIIQSIPAYASFTPVPIDWQALRERWIPGLLKDGLLAGLNWSGARAAGYDIEPLDLQRNVEALIDHDA